MTSIERIPVPSVSSQPRVQRKMPAPFQRPSISIGTPREARREWRSVLACDIKVGDIVPGLGRIYDVHERVDRFRLAVPGSPEQVRWFVVLSGGVSNVRTYQGNETVWAFTAEARAE